MSREEVIRQIVHRDVEQLSLSEEIVRRDAPALHEAACLQFGTWETALKYAGVTVRFVHSREKYTAERVIQELRTLCTSGYDLGTTRNLQRDRRLYEAARLHFGTWRKALEATGINLEHAFLGRRPRRLDKQKLLEAIKQRHAAGETLIWTDVCLENRAFASAAKTSFGSWRKALIAAEIDPALYQQHGRKEWDRERVIALLRKRYGEGKSLKCADTRREHSSLANAANRYFGSWSKALLAAGIEADPGQRSAEREPDA